SELENEEGLFIWNIIIKKATEYEVRLELKVLNNNSDLNRSDSNNSSDANII
ncbi:17209_t:CDS:1, partial [Rhizophagus irregularis]